MAEDGQPQRYLPSWDVLIGENFREYLEQVEIQEEDVVNARGQRNSCRDKTLEALELHWNSVTHWSYRWIITLPFKGRYLEGLLNDPEQRKPLEKRKDIYYERLKGDDGKKKKEHNHELCQVALERYDLHRAQVRVGEHLLKLYTELKLVVGGLELYQQEMKEKDTELQRYRAQLGEINHIRNNTEGEIALLGQVQEYILRYDLLSAVEKETLAEIVQLHQPQPAASPLILEDKVTRDKLLQSVEEVKEVKKNRLSNALSRSKFVQRNLDSSVGRKRYLYGQVEAHYDKFQEMLGYALLSREKFDNLDSEKQVPLLNPKADEMVREAYVICDNIEKLFQRNQQITQSVAERVTQSLADPEGLKSILDGPMSIDPKKIVH